MHSVLDDLRVETTRRRLGSTPLERIALALRLGDDDVALYRAAHGVSDVEARATFARARRIGRIESRVADSRL